jgi:antitoxin VapB
MALSIKNKEFEDTARELARLTGKSITESGLEGLRRELERQKTINRGRFRTHTQFEERMSIIRKIQADYAAIPTNGSTMTDDEVLGYDEFGIPSR